MANRNISYPTLLLGGLTPTAYWDFVSSNTAGIGRGHTPVVWTHLTGVDFDNDGVPNCVTPAMYYARSSNLTSELSTQSASLYTSNAATWFVQFMPDGPSVNSAYTSYNCVLQKATPGGPGNSRNGFTFVYNSNIVGVHLKPSTESPVLATVTVSGGTANKVIAGAFSFNTTTFRVAANGVSSLQANTPGAGSFIVSNANPLVLGHYWDYYFGSLKGWVMRVATWQDYVATAAELITLTTLFSDPCLYDEFWTEEIVATESKLDYT